MNIYKKHSLCSQKQYRDTIKQCKNIYWSAKDMAEHDENEFIGFRLLCLTRTKIFRDLILVFEALWINDQAKVLKMMPLINRRMKLHLYQCHKMYLLMGEESKVALNMEAFFKQVIRAVYNDLKNGTAKKN